MSPWQILPGQMSLWQLESVQDSPLKEAVERGDLVEFWPLQQAGKTVSLKETIHTYLQHVDKERCDEVYIYNDCCKDCEGRGCGRLYVADGNWKLHYPICMFTMPSAVRGLKEFVPNECTQDGIFEPTKMVGSEDCLYLNVFTKGKGMYLFYLIHT